jgi:hypothetical protein
MTEDFAPRASRIDQGNSPRGICPKLDAQKAVAKPTEAN